MPRLARKYLESSYYHIIVQGIDREYIFKEEKYKIIYKSILKKNLENTDISVLAYCIMDNHAHILIHSENVSEITKIMQKTNTSYAKLYNKTKKRVGYVFRDRYYTQEILTQEQLLNCIVYIHNNPVKANITDSKSKYLYSSYNEYLKRRELITQESVRLVFGDNEHYSKEFEKIHNKGTAEEIVNIIDIVEERKDSNEVIEEYIKKTKKKIEEIIKEETLFSELLLQLRHCSGLSLREMSKIFNINKDRLNKIINKNL